MGSIVYGGSIKQDQVLIRGTTPDAEAARTFTHTLNTREHLDGFDNIHLAHQRRDFLDGSDIHSDYAHFGFDNILIIPLAVYNDFL